jgi:hypothetical protein
VKTNFEYFQDAKFSISATAFFCAPSTLRSGSKEKITAIVITRPKTRTAGTAGVFVKLRASITRLAPYYVRR